MIWKSKLHNIWGDTTGDPKGQWCGLLMTSFLLAWTSFNKPSEVPVIRTNVTLMCNEYHDDVIKWKHFPRYWTFVRGIHRFPVNSPAQRPVTQSFDAFFDLRLDKSLSKQSWSWWFETLSCPLWRQRNDPDPKYSGNQADTQPYTLMSSNNQQRQK